jgi:hypothetical protein
MFLHPLSLWDPVRVNSRSSLSRYKCTTLVPLTPETFHAIASSGPGSVFKRHIITNFFDSQMTIAQIVYDNERFFGYNDEDIHSKVRSM